MKKTILSIFILQLVVLTFVGAVLFLEARHGILLHRGRSSIYVSASTDEEYNVFLSWMKEHDITALRMTWGSDFGVRVLHASDVTLNNRLVLLEGRLPNYGEFVSDYNTGSPNQSGVLQRFLPSHGLRVYKLDGPQRLNFYTHYSIDITCEDDLHTMIDTLSLEGVSVQLASTWNYGRPFFVSLLLNFLRSHIILMTILISASVLAMLVSLIQYIILKLKTINVLLTLGYSRLRIIHTVVSNLFFGKVWVGTIGLSCIIMGIFLLLSDTYRPFYTQVMTIFLTVVIFLTVIYFLILSCIILIYLRGHRLSLSLKGMRPHAIVQAVNYFAKYMSVSFFSAAIAFLVMLFAQLTTERQNMQSWMDTRDIYQVYIMNIGQVHDRAIMAEVHSKTTHLYQHLSISNNGFFMDANSIWAMELFGEDFPLTGLVTNHATTHISVSPNFFSFNPIIASTGVPVYQELDFSDNVLNLIVPNALSAIHEDLYLHFLEYLYFHRVDIHRRVYSGTHGETWNPSTREPLTVNIIPVKDGQFYFTFSPHIRQATGNKILDPVVHVYTGNLHPSYTYSTVTRALFFQHDSDLHETPDEYLAYLVEMDGFAFASSVWSMIANRVSQFQRDYFGTVFLSLFIVIGYLITSFSVYSNYFVRNRYSIMVKTMWGYSVFRRYTSVFVMLFLPILIAFLPFVFVAMTPLARLHLLPSLSVQWIFALGIFLVGIDVLYFVSMEKLLLKKSINSILKGDIS